MWKEQIEKLMEIRRLHAQGGGEERIRRQHAAGKLTAAERIALLLDNGSFMETDSCMSTDEGASAVGQPKSYPGDGVLTGWGRIDGRKVCVAAEDFTVVGGTLGKAHAEKIIQLQDLALKMRVPVIFLNDSGGARIEEGINALSGYGEIFQRHVRSSGVIPQICAILGPCSGGACYSPALCDFIFMVRGISNMFITGPAVVEAALGKRPSLEELGGADMHASVSGCIHEVYDDEAACLSGIRRLLSFLPSCDGELPPDMPQETAGNGMLHLRRAAENADSGGHTDWQALVPDDPRKSYDMRTVIRKLMDPHPDLFELQPQFAPNAITALTRLGGKVIGVIANQPAQRTGALDCDASDKISRFIRFCDCFGIPLLTLVDVPAFLPGAHQEQLGIIRHGAKILYAYAEACVPKISLILRKAYGGAYIAMNSKSLGADLSYAWPIAEIAVMGSEGAVRILHKKELASAPDPEKLLKQYRDEYEEQFLNPRIAMARGYVNEVILPEETRSCLISSFAFLSGKKRPPAAVPASHGNMPV